MSEERKFDTVRWGLIAVAVLASGGIGLWQGQSRARAQQTTPPAVQTPAQPHVLAATQIEAGRYIVEVGGCNDCHTPGFAMKNGQVPEAQWLTGDSMGYRGPWGTTYPSNLRLFVKDLHENDFVMIVRNRNSRPPMPWPSLHAMNEKDLRAVFAYIKSLGPTGQPAPEYVPPTEEPKTPWLSFEPVMPKAATPVNTK